ncbi:MAG: tetratricopeptide repeat protein, partial [Desulfobacteraceae bacterium]|nr:tetratricopeptide repeat protein [Desulfobacteraceae bacterium]
PAEQIALKERPTDSPEAYDHYLKGRHYYYNITFRDNELAEREFERALQLDPNYPLALAGLADAYVQRYKERFDYDEYWLDSAGVLIEKALALESDLAEAYESRAELLLEEDNITGALKAAEKAKELRPDWDEPYVHLGNIRQERGERSKALAMFDTALTLRASVDALCGRGNILQIRGQMDLAKAAYQAAVVLNPDHDRPYLELGGLYEELSEGEKAESLYQRAIEVRPDHVAGYQSLSFRLSNWGSIQEGEELLRGFVNRFPYNWDGFKALYEYLEYRGDYSAAFEVVEGAVKRNPERVWPHLLLAYLYAQGMSVDADSGHATSASEKAVLAVNRALSLRPNSGRVLEWAGFVYSSLNRLDEAMVYFEQALEVRPGNAETLDNIAWILTYAKEYEKAYEFARRAVKQSPGTWDYYLTLRLALVNLNRWPEFFEIIQKAAEVYGDDPRFLHHLAKEQCLAGDYEESIKTSRRALAAKRAWWWWLVSLGVSKWLSGDADGAIDAFKEEKAEYTSGYMIVEILKSEGKFREIEQYIESIKQETPDQLSGIYYWAGVASSYYMSMRRFDDALSVLNEYRHSGEETFAAENSIAMARCFLQKGDIVSARRLLEETLDGSTAYVRAKVTIELARLQTIIQQDMTEPLDMVEKLQSEIFPTQSESWAWIDAVTTELVSRLQYASGQYDEVVESLEHIRCDWHSASVSGHYRKAQLAAATNGASADKHLNHAISNLTRLSRGEWHWWSLADPNAYLALSLARAGKKDDSRQQIERALKLEPEREDIAYHAACAYSLIGDTALALQWLETAVERGYLELWWARVDPDLDPLRELPRFKEIMN